MVLIVFFLCFGRVFAYVLDVVLLKWCAGKFDVERLTYEV